MSGSLLFCHHDEERSKVVEKKSPKIFFSSSLFPCLLQNWPAVPIRLAFVADKAADGDEVVVGER